MTGAGDLEPMTGGEAVALRAPLPRADKRVLLVRCTHTSRCECHRLALVELRECTAREWAASAHVYPRITLPPVEPPDAGLRIGNAEGRRDVLGALGAYLALVIVVLLMFALFIHNLWRVIAG